MKEFDEHVPQRLKEIQDWFAGIITQTIDDNSQINPIAPSGAKISQEACKYIVPSPTLEPFQRIQIYNQQYWWRLLSTLHDNFSLTTRILGYYKFNNTIGQPYLKKHPPNHWSLNHLGETLPQWIRTQYTGKDKLLIQEAVDSDWGYNHSFFAGEIPSMNVHQAAKDINNTSLLKETLYLQPHLHLFHFKHALFPFRDEMLKKSIEEWEGSELPPLKNDKNYFYVLYRNNHYNITWVQVDEFEYRLIEKFKRGSTIEQLCQWIENQNGCFLQAAAENLHLWFQEWTIRQWLGTKKMSSKS